MKIKQEHFSILKDKLATLKQEDILKHGVFVMNEGKFKDFETRMAWDCFWACKLDEAREWYSYLNDEHLNTAIKKALKELNIKFI
jgi:hypothetical protein